MAAAAYPATNMVAISALVAGQVAGEDGNEELGAGDVESSGLAPRLFLPMVEGEAARAGGASAQTAAETSGETGETAANAAEAQAEIAADNQEQRLFLSYIPNAEVLPVSTPDDLPVDIGLYGGPYVGHEAGSDELELSGSASGTTYYVDCKSGKDSNNGKSTSAAWKSLDKANEAALVPGDRLLLKRGCGWVGPLDARWNGTAEKPIVIGAYGSGNLPKIRDSYDANVRITGNHQVIENLHVTLSSPPNPDPNCSNQPVARKTGFGFSDNASYNTVRNSVATKLAIGVAFGYDTHHNRLLYSTITDNNVVWTLTSTSTSGATGVLLHGNHHEIARNYFARNRPICTYTGVIGGISIELFGASNANIHHNIAKGDRVFAELGSNSTYPSRDNTFAYNLHVTGVGGNPYGARFVVTRGSGHPFGPVPGTNVYNNIVYFTGEGSKAVTCEKCGTGILALKNNILWASEPVWSDVPFWEAGNIYWDNDGAPTLKWNGGGTMHATSRVANPRFVNAANGDFHLKSSSPAIDRGQIDDLSATFNRDLDKRPVPMAEAPDSGSYEYDVALGN